MKYVETESIELKRTFNDSIEKEIVAFLNTHEGSIYIGVEDDGNICGVSQDRLDETMKKISDVITDKILPNPQTLVSTSVLYEESKFIIKIDVRKGNALYYIKKYGRSAAGCFIRIGTTSKSMTEEQIEKAYISHLQLPKKSMKDTAVLRKDYTFVKFKNYLSSKGIHYNENNFLDNFNLTTSDGRYNLLADLLADNNMTSIKVAVFKGQDKSEFLKRNEYGNTCLLYSLQQVLDYCEALNDTYVDLSVSPRKEKHMFNFEAFKEAWINACVHNKWTEGIPPAVYLFDDRFEIISYGGIPDGLLKEDFFKGKTKPVNKELMDTFLQCGVVEQSGHGVPTIINVYGTDAYEFSKDSITVTIPLDKQGFNKSASVNASVNASVKLNKSQIEILNIISSNKSITFKEIANILSKNESTIARNIKDLKEKGVLIRVGSDKSGHWEIVKQEDK